MKRLLIAMLFALTGCSHRLPAAPPHERAAPSFDALPAGLSVCWVEYGRTSNVGFPVTAGPTRVKWFRGTASGLLIRHPTGNVLVDAGNSPSFKKERKHYSLSRRIYFHISGAAELSVIARPSDAIRADGVDPASLRAFLPSHCHADHLGGLLDLPASTPVWMAQEDLDFVHAHARDHVIAVVPEQAAALDERVSAIPFAAKPYENFDESFDVFGDGSVVVVKLPGHTPGSVGTFVNLSPTRRFFHVGDLVFAREAIEKRQPKGWLIRPLDTDRAETGRTIAKVAQLAAMEPDLKILPAHELRAWQAIFGEKPGCLER